MSGVDELGMVAMIEHTYHKFHKLGMEKAYLQGRFDAIPYISTLTL